MAGAVRHAVPLEIDPAMLEEFDQTTGVATLGGYIMGTGWTVKIAVPSGFDTGPLHASILARLEHLDAGMSHWKPDSPLSRFNRSAVGSWSAFPADFMTVMAAGIAIAKSSGAPLIQRSAVSPNSGALGPTRGRRHRSPGLSRKRWLRQALTA